MPIAGTVQPVLAITPAYVIKGVSQDLDLHAAAGTWVPVAAYVVPAGHIWILLVAVLATDEDPLNAATTFGVQIGDLSGGNVVPLPGLVGAGYNGNSPVVFNGYLPLTEGCGIGAFASGNAGDTEIPLSIIYQDIITVTPRNLNVTPP
jgi:hypothetical protein